MPTPLWQARTREGNAPTTMMVSCTPLTLRLAAKLEGPAILRVELERIEAWSPRGVLVNPLIQLVCSRTCSGTASSPVRGHSACATAERWAGEVELLWEREEKTQENGRLTVRDAARSVAASKAPAANATLQGRRGSTTLANSSPKVDQEEKRPEHTGAVLLLQNASRRSIPKLEVYNRVRNPRRIVERRGNPREIRPYIAVHSSPPLCETPHACPAFSSAALRLIRFSAEPSRIHSTWSFDNP